MFPMRKKALRPSLNHNQIRLRHAELNVLFEISINDN